MDGETCHTAEEAVPSIFMKTQIINSSVQNRPVNLNDDLDELGKDYDNQNYTTNTDLVTDIKHLGNDSIDTINAKSRNK